MKTERVTVASLLFDPANVRKHGERNLDSIKSSLARFGQQKPIVVDADGIVRAGNGTLMAAKALGWDEIEIVRTNLRGSEATAYAIADNRTAELAEWDEAALAEQLAALQIDDETLAAATGFDASEIERMSSAFNVATVEPPELADGDREPFRQMTFTVHDSQAETIEKAIAMARDSGGHESNVNENGNGNAISFICRSFLNG